MDRIHRLLNCAYAEFNDPDYIRTFITQRDTDLAAVMSDTVEIGFIADELDTTIDSLCTRNEIFSSPEHLLQGFTTCHFLGHVLYRLAHESMLESPFCEILTTLQKRFEVNHRLFTRYDGSIRKSGDDYTDMRVYALCAIVFIKVFLLNHNFNYLNTAIKLNDLLLKSGWPIDRKDMPFVHAAVVLEQKTIMSEYEKYDS